MFLSEYVISHCNSGIISNKYIIILQGGTLALLQQEPEEGITRLERRLYFQTAHGHFKAGCPALALEVLSKLPARVRDEKPKQATATASVDDSVIHTGQFGFDTTDKSK